MRDENFAAAMKRIFGTLNLALRATLATEKAAAINAFKILWVNKDEGINLQSFGEWLANELSALRATDFEKKEAVKKCFTDAASVFRIDYPEFCAEIEEYFQQEQYSVLNEICRLHYEAEKRPADAQTFKDQVKNLIREHGISYNDIMAHKIRRHKVLRELLPAAKIISDAVDQQASDVQKEDFFKKAIAFGFANMDRNPTEEFSDAYFDYLNGDDTPKNETNSFDMSETDIKSFDMFPINDFEGELIGMQASRHYSEAIQAHSAVGKNHLSLSVNFPAYGAELLALTARVAQHDMIADWSLHADISIEWVTRNPNASVHNLTLAASFGDIRLMDVDKANIKVAGKLVMGDNSDVIYEPGNAVSSRLEAHGTSKNLTAILGNKGEAHFYGPLVGGSFTSLRKKGSLFLETSEATATGVTFNGIIPESILLHTTKFAKPSKHEQLHVSPEMQSTDGLYNPESGEIHNPEYEIIAGLDNAFFKECTFSDMTADFYTENLATNRFITFKGKGHAKGNMSDTEYLADTHMDIELLGSLDLDRMKIDKSRLMVLGDKEAKVDMLTLHYASLSNGAQARIGDARQIYGTLLSVSDKSKLTIRAADVAHFKDSVFTDSEIDIYDVGAVDLQNAVFDNCLLKIKATSLDASGATFKGTSKITGEVISAQFNKAGLGPSRKQPDAILTFNLRSEKLCLDNASIGNLSIVDCPFDLTGTDWGTVNIVGGIQARPEIMRLLYTPFGKATNLIARESPSAAVKSSHAYEIRKFRL